MSTPRLTESMVTARTDLVNARRVVVKIGSSSLTTLDGGISVDALNRLVADLQVLRARGTEVVLVSSGAIAAGLAPLGLGTRPADLATQQAAAAVGQGLLLAHYTRAFAQYQTTVSQVLLTVEDLMRRTQYTNALRTLEKLLSLGAVPVINENDAVATHEIRFGDNDRLAALTANLLRADALILLSDVDALYDGPPEQGGSPVSHVSGPEDLTGVTLGRRGKAGVGTGGMVTKVEAAQIVASSGIPALLTSAPNARRLFHGEDVGTFFEARGRRRGARSAWIAHLAHPKGRLSIDDGAVAAVVEGRRSLLPAGILALTGDFEASDPVEITDRAGTVRARGLVGYSSTELPQMLGRSTAELGTDLGPEYERAVIHADDIVRIETRL
ncbi:glutamate 5-kinase [Nesterenkonia sp. LB17]|uniref:glutamate 5-kinase n=1 Tax=unclassified Nesterenkonia TaxID=2629769 RepID=UPI001F4C81B7|nr:MULTISPECIES: glutamate 5-kinase [unclassified Nesterenkonia]MCH8559093.1 glutamate 5-kinase [Nesterenkonia sp. DZ6]MCH8563007.1 glutamate 5-kinase [Nesterenkonia sp. YGD6]MCH8565176.1 glutamate 5-kinase [Nesterenkonia sp. LB17]MCH8571428.1 glutamate 5-kinase [Nesterenkonia sp. AY15]